MSRRSIYTQRRSSIELKMTPLIDVVFLLLVFFVWTASFQRPEYTISTRLSALLGASATAQDDIPLPEEEIEDVVILIKKNGDTTRWTSNDNEFETLAQVHQHLQAIYQASPPPVREKLQVILDPEARTGFGDIIDTYDTARVVGFSKVGFAISES